MINLEIKTIEGFYNTEYRFRDIANSSDRYCEEFRDFIVQEDPNGNCQMFSMAYADDIIDYSVKDVKCLLKGICGKVSKRQMLLDIREDASDEILKLLKPFSKKQRIKRYVSSNNSKMMLVIIVLDRNKIFK